MLAAHCTNRAHSTFSGNWQKRAVLMDMAEIQKTQAFVLAGASVWRGGLEEEVGLGGEGEEGQEF